MYAEDLVEVQHLARRQEGHRQAHPVRGATILLPVVRRRHELPQRLLRHPGAGRQGVDIEVVAAFLRHAQARANDNVTTCSRCHGRLTIDVP
eukprot:7591190-Pyramimonas_sp.AAC.1